MESNKCVEIEQGGCIRRGKYLDAFRYGEIDVVWKVSNAVVCERKDSRFLRRQSKGYRSVSLRKMWVEGVYERIWGW